jgi:hypothetical protein
VDILREHDIAADLVINAQCEQEGIARFDAVGEIDTMVDVEIRRRVEQGYEIGRRSVLKLSGAVVNSRIEAFVGGKVILIARGQLI